jgi:flagellar biosynthetic protein FlhB
MPEEQGQARTEAPTQRRREEARSAGQVARSTDLSAALLLLGGAFFLSLFGPSSGRQLAHAVTEAFTALPTARQASPGWGWLGPSLQRAAFAGGSLVVGCALLAFLAGVLQVGLPFSPSLPSPQARRLSPAAGWTRLAEGWWVRLLGSLLKAAVVAFLVGWVLAQRMPLVAAMTGAAPGVVLTEAWQLCWKLMAAAGAGLLLLGLADYGYHRWRLEWQLRMTRQELREEIKREEGDPLVRARVRSLQREYARRASLRAVPQATVVLTNPTHIAVALRYERSKMNAPIVVA